MSERVTPIRTAERLPPPLELPSVDAVAGLEPAALPGFVTQLGALLAAAGARLAAAASRACRISLPQTVPWTATT